MVIGHILQHWSRVLAVRPSSYKCYTVCCANTNLSQCIDAWWSQTMVWGFNYDMQVCSRRPGACWEGVSMLSSRPSGVFTDSKTDFGDLHASPFSLWPQLIQWSYSLSEPFPIKATSSPVNLLLVSVQLQLSTVNPPLDGCFCLLDHWYFECSSHP